MYINEDVNGLGQEERKQCDHQFRRRSCEERNLYYFTKSLFDNGRLLSSCQLRLPASGVNQLVGPLDDVKAFLFVKNKTFQLTTYLTHPPVPSYGQKVRYIPPPHTHNVQTVHYVSLHGCDARGGLQRTDQPGSQLTSGGGRVSRSQPTIGQCLVVGL